MTQTKTAVKSFTELPQVLLELAKTQAKIAREEADYNLYSNELKQAYEEKINPLQKESDKLQKVIKKFCLKNAQEFKLVRSKKYVGATVGFRNNPPKVKTLNSKFSFEKALELVKKTYGKYFRQKDELNKDDILLDYAAKKVTDEDLAKVGLRVDNDETFYIDVDWTELQEKKSA